MATYKIVSRSGNGLPLNVYGSGTISGRRNVCLWNDTGSKDQKWSINSLGQNQQVRSMNNTSYMLNANTSTWNCDVYTSNSDTYVNFIALGNGVYRIQLKSNTSKYLTAEGVASGDNVSWAALNSASNDQKWKITEISSDSGGGTTGFVTENGPHSIAMPVSYNQKEDKSDNWFYNYGCAVCCAIDVASYYAGRALGKSDVPYTEGAYGWNTPYVNYTRVTGKTEAEYLTLIRQEIDAKRPVVVCICLPNNTDKTHFVVAYAYTGAGTSRDQILVLDPVGGVAGRTMKAAGEVSASSGVAKSRIYTIRKTSAK